MLDSPTLPDIAHHATALWQAFLSPLLQHAPELIGQAEPAAGSAGDARWFGIKPFDADFWPLLFRFGFDFAVLLVVVGLLYYRRAGDRDYAFTFLVFNPLVFFVCHLLSSVKLELGFAFGLFAVFSVLRYRTLTIPIKEMTYLFAVITLAIINALSNADVSYTELIFTNLVVVLLIGFLEYRWYSRALNSAEVQYERIDNIAPDQREELLEDLRHRTGLPIESVEILRTDFLRDTVRLKVYFRDPVRRN